MGALGAVCLLWLVACTSEKEGATRISSEESSASAQAEESRCFGRTVTMLGTEGDDQLVAEPGRDVILALGGDDVIENASPGDRLCAGAGNDTVVRAFGPPWRQVMADLGPGNDVIETDSFVNAGAGDDLVRSRGGGAYVVLGPGDDRLEVGGGTPCLDYRRAGAGIRADLADGWSRGEGTDELVGVRCLHTGRHDDVITGSVLSDVLLLGGGADSARTGAGHDRVSGGAGVDPMCLGTGRDSGYGDAGRDRIIGGAGADTLYGSDGADLLRGGPGNDHVHGTGQCDPGSSAGTGLGDPAPNRLHGGPGDDEVTGDLGDDVVAGGGGRDRGYGGPRARPGNDLLTSMEQITACP